jgi:tight adherence protein B
MGLDEVVARVRASGIKVYTVGLRGNEFDAGPLSELASAGGGRYMEAPSVDALSELYASLAREIQNQFKVTIPMDEAQRGAGSGQIQIVARVGKARAEANRGFFYPVGQPTTEATQPSPAATPLYVPPITEKSWLSGFIQWNGSDYLVALLVFLIILAIGYILIGVLMPKRNVLTEYSDILDNRRQLGPRSAGEQAQRPGEAFAARLMSVRDLDDPLQKRIESAGWPIRTSEFALFHLMGLAILTGLAAMLGLPPIFVILLAVIAVILPIAFLDNRARKRRANFESQVPDTLLMMANSFRAGQSFEQAMQVVATEGPDPTRTEFGRVLAQQRLGVDPEVALRTLADRMQSEAFDWVVMATIIQRQVGGNLAEVYENIARTLRERVKLYRLVRTLTAEGRLSLIILIALPLLIGVVIFTLNPDYMEPLYTTQAGQVMLSLMAFGMLAGTLWMRKLIRIDA